LNDRSEQERWEERERPDQDDHADQQDYERRVVGAHGAEPRGAHLLACERARNREREEDRRVTREHHVQATEDVRERDAV
jgi:hypothetical protein